MDNLITSLLKNENRKALIIALILLIAIPLTFYLVRQTQILKSRAANSANVTFLNNNGNLDDPNANPPTVRVFANPVQMRLQFIPEPTSVPPTTAPTAVPTVVPPAQPALPCVNETNCVFGYVGTLDNTNTFNPLAGVTVRLTDRPSQITLANGLFAFHGLPNGEYTLSVLDTLPTSVPVAFRSYTSLHSTGLIYNSTLTSSSALTSNTFTLNSSSVSMIYAIFAYYDPNRVVPSLTGVPSPTVIPTLGTISGSVSEYVPVRLCGSPPAQLGGCGFIQGVIQTVTEGQLRPPIYNQYTQSYEYGFVFSNIPYGIYTVQAQSGYAGGPQQCGNSMNLQTRTVNFGQGLPDFVDVGYLDVSLCP